MPRSSSCSRRLYYIPSWTRCNNNTITNRDIIYNLYSHVCLSVCRSCLSLSRSDCTSAAVIIINQEEEEQDTLMLPLLCVIISTKIIITIVIEVDKSSESRFLNRDAPPRRYYTHITLKKLTLTLVFKSRFVRSILAGR
jgi:hypothetical protein